MYTQEDKEAFARKDRLIVAQSTLERAIEYHTAKQAPFTMDDVLDTARQLFHHVFLLADGVDKTTNTTMVDTTPTPTLTQVEWLDKIKEKYGYGREEVWNKCKKYPSNKEEAIEIMKILKGN